MFLRINIRAHERGLVFRNGVLVRVLGPGTHVNPRGLWTSGERVQVVPAGGNRPVRQRPVVLTHLRDAANATLR